MALTEASGPPTDRGAMTRLSPAKAVTSMASQDRHLGSLPGRGEQMVHIRQFFPIPLSNNGMTRNAAAQRAMEATENV
jgi:hypothetical protein